MTTMPQCLIALATVVLLAATGSGFINMTFTPVELARDSNVILVLEFKSADTNSGLAVASVQKVMKGKYDSNEFRVNLLALGEAFSAQGKSVIEGIQKGEGQAVLFYGTYDTGRDSVPEDSNLPRGFLHWRETWIVLDAPPTKGEPWGIVKFWEMLNATWYGGTDMLIRCAEYALCDPDARVPAVAGVEWDSNSIARVGKVPGRVSSALPVDISGTGEADLFVASESRDHVFRWDGNALVDVTAKLGLTSKSAVSAWGNFNGDGKLALACWDGKALSIHSRKADGTFAAKAADMGEAMKEGCLSLSAIDAGVKGRAGLLVGTKAGPVLLVPQGEGAFRGKPLGTGVPMEKLGAPGVCLVADLDGDGLIDVLQVFSDGSLFCKGSTPGAFAAPVRCSVAAGPGRWGACLGDFDGDGLQEVFIASEGNNGMWQNLGGGRFANALYLCGSLAYISKSGGIGAWSGDFNNDGLQDLLIAYGINMAPHQFFNRGFRSFGQARDLDLVEQKGELDRVDPTLVAEADSGQQAACLGDFNGDGALDMVLVLANGDVVFFPRKVTRESPALGVIASLPLSAPTPGPVNVRAYKGERLLGAWIVRTGEPGTIIGTRTAGPITLKWTWPGGKQQEKRVVVRDGPVRVLLGGQ